MRGNGLWVPATSDEFVSWKEQRKGCTYSHFDGLPLLLSCMCVVFVDLNIEATIACRKIQFTHKRICFRHNRIEFINHLAL